MRWLFPLLLAGCSVADASSFYGASPGGFGGEAGSAPAGNSWITLTLADSTGTLDPNSLANGTVTMSGDYWQIPVDANIATRMDQAYVHKFAIPTGFADGTTSYLRTRLTFGTAPTTTNAVSVGFFDTGSNLAASAGMRLATGDGKMRPVTVKGALQSEGSGVSSTALAWEGIIRAEGPWDGVGAVAATATSIGVQGTAAQASTIDGAGVAVTATTHIVLAVTDGFGTGTETLDVKAEYLLIEE